MIAVLNPNIQALLFAVLFAVLLRLCARMNGSVWMFWVLLAIFTGITLYLKSVTGLFSVFTIFYYAQYGPTLKKVKFLVLCFGAGLLFIINMPSIYGRLHILNINRITLAGVFPGKAATYHYAYNHAQIDYFKHNGLNAHPAFLADEGGYALNDVLQMTIVHGLPGLLVMITLYLIFFYTLLESGKKQRIKGMILPLLPFYIFIPVSYPLQIPYLTFCFILLHVPMLLHFISNYWGNKPAMIIRQVLFLCVAAFTLLFADQLRNEISSQNKLNKAIGLWDSGFHAKALKQLNELKQQLRYDKRFIFYISKYKHLSNENTEALAFLKVHHKYGCGYDYHILLADVYNELGRTPLAIEEYNNALFLVPHKLESRYKLMQLYNIDKKDSAIYYARQLLSIKLKAGNPRSEYYKIAATGILKLLRPSSKQPANQAEP